MQSEDYHRWPTERISAASEDDIQWEFAWAEEEKEADAALDEVLDIIMRHGEEHGSSEGKGKQQISPEQPCP